MEWMPKLLDNLDSAAFALYQSWGGYYRWIFLRLAMAVIGVSTLLLSPMLRSTAIAIVVTYVAMTAIDGLIARFKPSRVARTQS